MTQAELVARGEKVLMRNCRRAPLVMVGGEGSRVRDADGRSYLDFISGVAVNAFGHAPAFLARALAEQAARLVHVSNLYYSAPQILAAERLAAFAGMDRVFFCNSGAEAVEAAVKLARKYGRERLGGRYEIITAIGSFHGRTMGALAATGQEKYQRDFAPLPPGFRHAAFNDLAAWEAAVTPATCALMIEPIQGEGGVHPATPEFIRGLADLAGRRGLLLIFDEVQTGMGRTGRPFAWQHWGVKPDLITAAKGIGGGFPVGALLCREEADVFAPGDHQATFGGNPLAACAVLACLEEFQARALAERAAALGAEARRAIEAWRLPVIREVRGLGLMIGLEIARDAAAAARAALDRGLLLNAVRETTLRLAPPLTITAQELEEGLAIIRSILEEDAPQPSSRGPGRQDG
ncbi:MAG: aspartate aminotransferase family protein [Bacteroidota bacterium]